jgi:hypothetical protein
MIKKLHHIKNKILIFETKSIPSMGTEGEQNLM